MEDAKIVTFAKYGAPLEVTPLKLRELKPRQILIKVYASSLNPIDFKRKHGATKMLIKDEFPAGVCFDVSGLVEKVGSEITDYSVGQRVCARSRHSGTLADFCIVDEDVTSHLPDNVSFVDAAALPLAGQTALQSLRQGGLKEGETVFISGGAGGVGTYAVQLAKHVFKAGKVVTTCSASKMDFCKSLGADECIDYTKGNPYHSATPYDVVFDTVGDARKMGGSLIKPGKFVISVASTPDAGGFDRINMPLPFVLRGILSVISLREKWGASPGIYRYVFLLPNAKDLTELVGYLSEGKIKSVIDSVFTGLDASKEAFERIETNRAKGKVVVSVRTE
jgi:alcohol dehydrogenase